MIYNLNTILQFGKFKGKTVESIITYSNLTNKYTNYMIWASNNIPNVILSNEVKESYRKMLNKKTKEKLKYLNSSSNYQYEGDHGAHSCPGDYMGMGPSDFGIPNC